MGALKSVIFDMDGVMVDTEPVYFASNRELFARLGFEVPHEVYAQFVGLDAQRMWGRLKQQHGLPQPVADLVRMEVDGMLAGLHGSDLAAMPGLPELLAALHSRAVPLALASSSARQVIRTILHKLKLEGAFAVVVSGEEVAHGKPAPDIFLRAASLLGLAPADCLVIEDSANGVRAARAAGMRCVGFQNPNSGFQDLSPADLLVPDFSTAAIAAILAVLDASES